ncbi:MAG: hypothetical protein HY401_07735 [Elusimicrobia bacterium]|nr:hypothetical protein [Elusimicrobiota bacterium]
MESELKHSMRHLKMEDSPALYFLLYRLTISQDYRVQCLYGDVSWKSQSDNQTIFVEARVGDYNFDNSWEGFSSGVKWEGGSLSLATAPIAFVLWHNTDDAYKNAVRKYNEKRAALAQEMEEEKLPDFSREKPSRADVLGAGAPQPDIKHLKRLCVVSSAQFKKYPEVKSGYTYFSFKSETRLLVTSEGTRLIQEGTYNPIFFYIHGEARASDGLMVDSFRSGHARHETTLPSEDQLAGLVQEVAHEVAGLKLASLEIPQVAPAILDGESTGVFFHEALGHRLEGLRQRERGELQTFKDKVGQRVIPAFLSVRSNPALNEFNESTLNGHYLFDSEGVAAQNVALVNNGILKNYLMSRRPIKGFARSNGNGRSNAGSLAEGRMSVLIIETGKSLGVGELKEELLKEIKKRKKPFGFRLIAMRSGEAQTGRGSSQSFISRPRLIYRVAPDGTETLVRGLEYVGTPLIAIEKITAAGNDPTVSNAYCGSTSGFIPVTEIAPSVLISEIELQRQSEDRFRPPILKSPIFR